MYCGYCGRVQHRCVCQRADSDIIRFLARAGRRYQPAVSSHAPKWGVPPQVKRRERQILGRHYRQWYQQLAAEYGEYCANCRLEAELVLDHIIPIARGGKSQLENLQLLCATCNRIKGKLTIDCRGFKHPEYKELADCGGRR